MAKRLGRIDEYADVPGKAGNLNVFTGRKNLIAYKLFNTYICKS